MVNHNRNFTLIETLVAVAILLIGVLAPLTIIAGGLKDGLRTRDRLVATHLLAEARELAWAQVRKNTRDFNPPFLGMSFCLSADCGIVFDPAGTNYEFKACSDSSMDNCRMRYNTASGFYEYGCIGADCIGPVFTNSLRVIQETGGDRGFVEMIVDWVSEGRSESFNSSFYVFNIP